MSKIVIDASSTLAWLFEEDASAGRVKRILETSELVAPWLWLIEMTNVILVRERRKVISEAQSSQLLQLVDEMTIELVGEPAARTASGLAQVSRPHQLSAYDAVYLDLAMRTGLPLFTRDNNLRLAAKRVGVELVD